ncbi:hypothetical protein [Francisella uliginis]|uniref:Uncharacterized protein n=1 Tax=Francisella uliginis TaxID=573570 RepID=A0A1L4BR08_9GAMM|nr:hypothetical protein [Francisella uliginis]API86271.1 hypothetical protein F7310_02395 [Francisella uliginis]
MKKNIIFLLFSMTLSYGAAFADTNATQTKQDTASTTVSQEATSANQTSKNQAKSKQTATQGYGDDLSIMVDTSNASYDALLADAEKILADRDNNKKPSDQEIAERIQHINKHTDNKVVVEKNQRQAAMQKDVKAAGDILKRHNEISKDFKDSYGAYQGDKSTKDYITKEAQGYNDADAYQMKNYKELLADVKTPKQIDNSFNKIDSNSSKSKYKLSDGYSIEDVTTVGALTGQNKRLKKCLIMKTYGGGTWRTYCQPLKKPTQCPDYDWKQLSTMAIMYC